MKLKLGIIGFSDAFLKSEPKLKGFTEDEFIYWFDVEDPILEKVFSLSSKHEPLLLCIEGSFTNSELDQVEFYVAIHKKKMKESDRDFNYFSKFIASQARPSFGPWGGIMLCRDVSIKPPKIKANEFVYITDWMCEYIVGSFVKSVFEEEGLSGASFLPVYARSGGETLENVFQLYTEEIAPNAMDDPSYLEIPVNETWRAQRRKLCCLVYKQSEMSLACASFWSAARIGALAEAPKRAGNRPRGSECIQSGEFFTALHNLADGLRQLTDAPNNFSDPANGLICSQI